MLFGGVILPLLMLVNGCGLVGALYGNLIDPLIPAPMIEAEHKMTDRTVLIWIDDFSSPRPEPLLRRQLIERVREELLDHDAAGAIVEPHRVTQFRQAHPDFSELPIQQLGRQFQADEVLYILIEEFSLRHDAGAGFYQSRIAGYAKVVEVASGKRLWPTDRARRPFALKGKLEQGQGQFYENQLIGQLARNAAQTLAPFFYRHRGAK